MHRPGPLDLCALVSAFVCVIEEPSSLSPIVHQPEVMLGMLVAIFHLNPVAAQSSFPGKRQVPLIVAMRVAPRAIVPLPLRGIGPAIRRPSSLRSLIAVADWTHQLDLP